ncbi:hypothetical protein ABZP36_020627 [Zizania latifolia]
MCNRRECKRDTAFRTTSMPREWDGNATATSPPPTASRIIRGGSLPYVRGRPRAARRESRGDGGRDGGEGHGEDERVGGGGDGEAHAPAALGQTDDDLACLLPRSLREACICTVPTCDLYTMQLGILVYYLELLFGKLLII